MHTRTFAIAAAFASAAIALHAGPLPDHMGERSLLETAPPSRLSLGANFELLERAIDVSGREGLLEGTGFSGYLGLDATRWLTVFGTAGALTLDSATTLSSRDDFDSGLRWSAGLNASLWHTDTKSPDYLRGRFSIGATIEYLDSEAAGTDADLNWSELAIALPIGFEIPNEPMAFWGVHSLFIYAGPLFSDLDGTAESRGGETDWQAGQDTGVLAGLAIYTSPNVALGANAQIFEDLSVTASLRYHF